MRGQDGATVVRRLLAAAGGRGYELCLAEFERLGEEGCDLMFATLDAADDTVGADGAHPRDVAEDIWQALRVAARRWPDRFLNRVVADPSRHHDIAILDALGEVDRPQARALLIAAANERRAGHALGREYALRSLIRLADPSVADLLLRLVKDRDFSVRLAAVRAAVQHGDARLLPALRDTAQAAGTPAGTRQIADAAIEAITRRSGRA